MMTAKVLYFFLLIILSITSSCENTLRSQAQNTQYQEIYLDQFKLTYFKQLLKKSYNNSNTILEIIGNDHSGFTEPVLSEQDFKIIDSLTTLDNQRLIADSSESHLRVEGAQGKRPLGFIMDRLTSKWLDSLAKSRLKLSSVSYSWND